MRAPEFWSHGRGGLASTLLAPAGALYGLGVRIRFAATRPVKAGLPVICVGNFVAGGGGKTPAALALHRLLSARGLKPAFLSRGYGGQLKGPVAVDDGLHRAGEVGDEPLLLARQGLCIVSADRPAGAALAADQGAHAVIMDDGLQNPSLCKDVALAIVDSAHGFGNGRIFPAGPLRAALSFQAGLIDAVVLTGEGGQAGAVRAFARAQGLPVFAARLVPREGGEQLGGKRVVAFAGIARPEKFFLTLQACGAEIAARLAFGDHHLYSETDARRILDLARRLKAVPVTTEKDHVRLGGFADATAELARAAQILAVVLEFENAEGLLEVIEQKLAGESKR